MGSTPECPECGSHDTRKRGFNIRKRKPVQRWQCKGCWRVFTEPEKVQKVQLEVT